MLTHNNLANPGLSQAEADIWRCFVKKVFLEIWQNSRENNRARDSFLTKLQACSFTK